MEIRKGNDPLILLIGDVFFWTLALWLSLFARYVEVPHMETFFSHLYPFLLIFFCWAVVFFIFNLYGHFVGFFREQLAVIILQAQIANSLIAVAFFYFFPGFGISPKTILLIDLAFSFVLIFIWRFLFVPFLFRQDKERAILLGRGEELEKTRAELESKPYFFDLIIPEFGTMPLEVKQIEEYIEHNNVTVVLASFRDKEVEKVAARLYNNLFTKVRFLSLERVYEELFGRVPLALISDGWILENISYRAKRGYAVLKRLMDVCIALSLSIVTLPIVLVAMIAIVMESRGGFFIIHDRVGKDGALFKTIKLRTMTTDDHDKPTVSNDPRVTRIGRFLRKTRIDELPQLWNVLEGSMSLVGPRPELPFFVNKYATEIPYYNIRHIIAPGISGWAQINYDVPAYDTRTTSGKLEYDLYYLKNRSVILDLKIALKTIKTLISRKGI